MESWTNNLMATAQAEGMVARLNKTEFRSAEVQGCDNTHQVGWWTSNAVRPRGQIRYAETTEFTRIGQLMYVPAGIPWVARFDRLPKLTQALYCDFDRSLFSRVSGIEVDDTPHFLSKCLSIESLKLRQAISLLLEEVRQPGFAHEIAVGSLGNIILLELGRHFRSIDNLTERPVGTLSSWQMDRINAYVKEVEGPLAIADIAQLCGISTSHLRRQFKATTNITISGYLASKRIELAQIMLTDKRIFIKEIAFRLGFASGASFSAAFRRAVGVSPIAYRQMF